MTLDCELTRINFFRQLHELSQGRLNTGLFKKPWLTVSAWLFDLHNKDEQTLLFVGSLQPG